MYVRAYDIFCKSEFLSSHGRNGIAPSCSENSYGNTFTDSSVMLIQFIIGTGCSKKLLEVLYESS